FDLMNLQLHVLRLQSSPRALKLAPSISGERREDPDIAIDIESVERPFVLPQRLADEVRVVGYGPDSRFGWNRSSQLGGPGRVRGGRWLARGGRGSPGPV